VLEEGTITTCRVEGCSQLLGSYRDQDCSASENKDINIVKEECDKVKEGGSDLTCT
jgi:hypothetical protein